MSTAPEPARFETTGPFRLVRRLGEGGFAPVYLAEEVHGGRKLRDVALKLFFLPEALAPSSGEAAAFRERVLDEARALCRVEHPNVVRFFAVHRDDERGVMGLAMEYVRGEGLDVRLREGGPLGDEAVLEVGAAVAWALAAVHDAGLVHGDVKPSNIVRGASGHGYKLIDFGIAADLDPAAQKPAALAGTPGYIAPERLHHGAPASPAADLFALGITLFKLRWGALPALEPTAGATSTFDAVAAERGQAQPAGDGAVARPISVRLGDGEARDGELGALIARLHATDPHARPPHAASVAAELEAIRLRRSGTGASAEGARARSDSLPAPPSAPTTKLEPALTPHPPLVARDAALAALAAAAARARRGQIQVSLIRGPLGAGRTRLLDAAIEAADFPEGRVLRGVCSPERRSPLLPLARAVEELALPGKGLAALEEAIDEALAPEALRASRDARAAIDAVEEALLWAAAAEPLLLAIDDAQWGDPYTLALLASLCERARAGSKGRLFVVVTARDEPRPPAELKALLAAARSRPDGATASIALGPLDRADLTRLAEGAAPLSPELLAALVRGSGGIPFFLVHALFAWRDTGAISFRGGAWRAVDPARIEEGVPGVADLIEARLESAFDPGGRSHKAALRALAAVALYGGGLEKETLVAVCGGAAVAAALATLESMQILVVRGGRDEHSFAQEMVRQAVLNLVRRKPWFPRLHRALLDTLASSREADPAFLAAGYDALGAAPQAREWLRRAMEAAVAAGLIAEAVEMGNRRAALAESPAARVAATLDTVRALLVGRRFAEAEVRLRLLEAPGLAHALDGQRGLLRRIYRLQAARGLDTGESDGALIADADASGELALRCEARMAVAAVLGGSPAVALAGEAVALAERADPALEYAARVGRAELIYGANPRDLGLAQRDLTRALAIAEATGSRLHRLQVESDLAAIEAERGDAGAAIERFARLVDEAEAHGMRGERRRLTQNRAALLLREGRAAEAAEAAAEVARLAEDAGDPGLCAIALSMRADALRRTGDVAAALASIDKALRLQEENGDRTRALSLLRRAEIAEALGRSQEAARDAAEARLLASARGARSERWIETAAALWLSLHEAREGRGGRDEVERALSDAAAPEVATRALVRSLAARARAWLDGDPAPG